MIFPNLVINDGSSVTVRTFYPQGADKMHVTAWALGPVEEGENARARRLDAFLTFYGPGGFATPDDVEALELVQQGLANWHEDRWSEMSRGMGKESEQLNSDEHHLRIFWRRWNELMGARGMTVATRTVVTRAQVEDFLYHEAALLDEWRLDEWETLLADDAAYYVPPNDKLESDHRTTLFIIADDRERIRQRVIRINDPNCHAEYPKSRTRRMISNVRIVSVEGDLVTVTANFVCYRFRRYERIREYVGGYRFILRQSGDSFRIKERRVLIDAHELGTLGSVSFIL